MSIFRVHKISRIYDDEGYCLRDNFENYIHNL